MVDPMGGGAASLEDLLELEDPALARVRTSAEGPPGRIPVTRELLLERPSGDLFGWSQNAGMGWDPAKLGGADPRPRPTGGVRRCQRPGAKAAGQARWVYGECCVDRRVPGAGRACHRLPQRERPDLTPRRLAVAYREI